MTFPDNTNCTAVAKDRADWLVDAVATATQNRAFLRGEAECDDVACTAIFMNGEKAILTAMAPLAAEVIALRKRVEAADAMAELIEPYVVCVVATEGGNSYALRAALAAYRATGAA
jgi:hypothetical protein